MDDAVSNEDIASVGRGIVAAIAPEELLLFRLHSEAYFRDPKKAVAPPKSGEDSLGFGAGELVGVVTPFVLMALRTVLTQVAQELGRELGAQARAGVRRLSQRLFGPTDSDSIPLTAEQLARIHEVVTATAGRDRAVARRVADGIVNALQSRPAKQAAGP